MILYLTYLFSIYDSSISFHNEEKMNEKRIFWIWFANDLQRIMYIFCLQQCWENSRKDSFFVCALTLFPHIYFLLWYAQSTQKTLFTFMLLFAVVIILRISYSLCFVVVIIFFLFHTWRGRINIISIKLSRVVTDAHEYWP